MLNLSKLDTYTFNHVTRCCKLSEIIEKQFRLNDNTLSTAALYHDIGKYYIPSGILLKCDNLTELERTIVDLHSFYTYVLLKEEGFDERLCSICLMHHYENPPILYPIDFIVDDYTLTYARYLRTIDMYEALTADRPYKRHMSKNSVYAIMSKNPNIDIRVLNVLIQNDDES